MAAFENGKWQSVPGAASARLFPCIREPDLLRSNCFVLDLPGAVIVIDPASDMAGPEMGPEAAVREALAAVSKPVIGILTHIHIDHSMRAGEFRDRLKPHANMLLAVHEYGLGLIEAGDLESTLAELYGKPMAPLHMDLCLKSQAPGSEYLMCVSAGRGGQPLPFAGPGRDVEIYHTPGHSPDSICLRVGRLLFSGDILFALNPFVAGIKGWSRDELIDSLRLLQRVMEDHGVEWLLPGHGGPMAVADARKLLAAVLDQARKMSSVAGVSRRRIEEAMEYANELLDELELVFTGISGRLFRVAHYLDEIGEASAAEKIRTLLDSDALDALLAGLRSASGKVRSGERLDIYLVHDAIRSVRKALRIIRGSAIEGLIPGFLLSRAHNSLKDFLTYASGLESHVSLEPINVNASIQGVLNELGESRHATDEDLSALDDAGFARAIAERMAYLPALEGIAFSFDPGHVPVSGLANGERFRQSLACLLQHLGALGADRIGIRSCVDAEFVRVTLDASKGNAPVNIPAVRKSAHSRHFAMAGISLKAGLHGEALRLALTLKADPVTAR